MLLSSETFASDEELLFTFETRQHPAKMMGKEFFTSAVIAT